MSINSSLKFLTDELDAYMKLRLDAQEQKVALTQVADPDGSVSIPVNCLGITLVNVEEEKVAKAQGKVLSTENGVSVKKNPDIKLNLYLLFAANYTRYPESLKAISALISFFQKHPFMDAAKFPNLPPPAERLIFEMQSTGFEQLNHLWGTLGAKYMPSVLYKMRMLIIDEDAADSKSIPIREYQIKNSRAF